ncbi:hypothetical protein [Cellulophaga sp. L1A9]|uniref:hypothetical protein n=1 Tax=Cellulophaga sp. L1A9 TaxID=2686362 RepID=UPI00131E5607|nr:hypothetical protein [Cellulophaga sp. L1A9]
MKTIKSGIILSLILIVFGCQREHKKDVESIIEGSIVHRLPNESDENFSKALASIDKQNLKDAAVQLKKGLVALQMEGMNVTGLYKVNLEKAIDVLNRIEVDLKNGEKIPTNVLRETIANAEINIAHNYLSTEDTYVLAASNETISHKTKRNFYHSFSTLKKEEGKMKVEVKKEGDSLLREGQKLDQEYKAWEKRVKEYTKKTSEHLKKRDTAIYEEMYWE